MPGTRFDKFVTQTCIIPTRVLRPQRGMIAIRPATLSWYLRFSPLKPQGQLGFVELLLGGFLPKLCPASQPANENDCILKKNHEKEMMYMKIFLHIWN